MLNTGSRVLRVAFVAALCAALSACSGGGPTSNSMVPQASKNQAPSAPSSTLSTSAESVTVVDAASIRAAASSNYTYSKLTYRTFAPYKAGSSTASRKAMTTIYPDDLANVYGGPTAGSLTTHNVYIGCSTKTTCWGNPYQFLKDLGGSSMLHVADQYTGGTSLTPGAGIVLEPTLYTNTIYDNDLLRYLHLAIQRIGSSNVGLNHMYNLFLAPGLDTCFDQSTVCYSPDNPANMYFCAYHGAVTFSDYGTVLFSVEPYQGAGSGCDYTPSGENTLDGATANVLSHETFETITDPIPPYGFINPNTGAEIGDECAWFSITPENLAKNRTYNMQLEYSNAVHACSDQPST